MKPTHYLKDATKASLMPRYIQLYLIPLVDYNYGKTNRSIRNYQWKCEPMIFLSNNRKSVRNSFSLSLIYYSKSRPKGCIST